MGEVVNVVVAFAVIVILFRWVTSPSSSSTAGASLGFRPKNVTQPMVDTVHAMFPDIPQDNIRFDLLRTGNVEVTTNKILEKGFLDAPTAAYFTIYPRTPAQTSTNIARTTNTGNKSLTEKQSLIDRYNLQSRVASLPSTPLISSEEETSGGSGGKAVWEDSAEKREASLKERKAQMILAARQRMLAQQAKTTAQS